MNIKYIFLATIAVGILFPAALYAGEIQYHSIQNVYGDTADVKSRTPSGETFYRCSLTKGACQKHDDDTASLLPTLNEVSFSETSRAGAYGVMQTTLTLGDARTAFYSLYNLSDADDPKFVGLFMVQGEVVKTQFSPDESTYIAITKDGRLIQYDTKTKTAKSLMLPQKDVPFFSLSHRGTYASFYNYIDEAHIFLNLTDGSTEKVAGAPSMVEFSENEKAAAFIVENDGFRNLAEVSVSDMNVSAVAEGSFLVEDYVYLNSKLYYLSNEASPLNWALYDATSGERLADNVPYETYFTRYGDLFVYGKIEEKNLNLYTFDGTAHTKLDAAPNSERVAGLSREERRISGRTTAVIMPEDIDDGDLYIWLHGGPRRQTSLGYHPYMSYAVYDELLENIAAAGNYVAKLDYSGSWGYGKEFIESLQDNVGQIEIDDVENVIEHFEDTYDIDNVYLIGNSYGGYMAFRGLNALTNKVDGIISINGVADWYTLVQQIPSSPFNTLFGGIPSLATLDRYLAASAFINYEDIDDQPMLVVYGSEDKTVPKGQSAQYAEFMKTYNKDVTLLELTGAEHAITRRENLDTLCEAIRDIFVRRLSCS